MKGPLPSGVCLFICQLTSIQREWCEHELLLVLRRDVLPRGEKDHLLHFTGWREQHVDGNQTGEVEDVHVVFHRNLQGTKSPSLRIMPSMRYTGGRRGWSKRLSFTLAAKVKSVTTNDIVKALEKLFSLFLLVYSTRWIAII